MQDTQECVQYVHTIYIFMDSIAPSRKRDILSLEGYDDISSSNWWSRRDPGPKHVAIWRDYHHKLLAPSVEHGHRTIAVSHDCRCALPTCPKKRTYYACIHCGVIFRGKCDAVQKWRVPVLEWSYIVTLAKRNIFSLEFDHLIAPNSIPNINIVY